MKTSKKHLAFALASVLMLSVLTACGNRHPFNIATKDGLSDTAQDFIDFIMSSDGQGVIEENGYISVSDRESYSGEMDSGKIIIAGSSSVAPVMEKLKEAYLERNPGVKIEIQQSDSSTGMSDTIDGTCVISAWLPVS